MHPSNKYLSIKLVLHAGTLIGTGIQPCAKQIRFLIWLRKVTRVGEFENGPLIILVLFTQRLFYFIKALVINCLNP